VGRKVAAAAAANLTPTTLELGGKSPCILDASCNMADAALKIAHRAYVIEGGRIVLEGDPSSLLNNQAVRKAYIGA
jgi:acyl-CoA reductase-like NAD-dependent aldehyde dehydrogenase